MTPPIYVISGRPRSGTSMMMRCLEAGGLRCIYDANFDKHKDACCSVPGYLPNPNGYYEPHNLVSQDWATFRGCAIKVLFDQLTWLKPGHRYRIVYMLRDVREIRPSWGKLARDPADESLYCCLDDYEAKAAADVAWLAARSDTEVVTRNYADVVRDPIGGLSLGWPIDVIAAAAKVDPSLYRHRAP